MAFRSLIDCGDLVLGFGRDAGTGGVTLAIVPRSHRDALSSAVDASGPSVKGEPVVQVALSGETARGSRQGRSMLNGSTTAALHFVDQRVRESAEGVWVETDLQADGLVAVTQYTDWTAGDRAVRAHTMVKNVSRAPLDLTMVTSFCLSGLSPFPALGGPGTWWYTGSAAPGAWRRSWSARRWTTCTSNRPGSATSPLSNASDR